MQRPLKNPYRSSTKYYHVKYLHANMSKNNHRGEPCKHVNISQITSRVPDSVLRWLSKTWGTVCKSWRETERKIRSLYSTDVGISWKCFQWKQVRYCSDTDCGRGRLCFTASYDLGPTNRSCKSCMCLQLCFNGFSAGSKIAALFLPWHLTTWASCCICGSSPTEGIKKQKHALIYPQMIMNIFGTKAN